MLGHQKSPSIKKNGLALGVSGLAKPLEQARHGSCIAYMLFWGDFTFVPHLQILHHFRSRQHSKTWAEKGNCHRHVRHSYRHRPSLAEIPTDPSHFQKSWILPNEWKQRLECRNLSRSHRSAACLSLSMLGACAKMSQQFSQRPVRNWSNWPASDCVTACVQAMHLVVSKFTGTRKCMRIRFLHSCGWSFPIRSSWTL